MLITPLNDLPWTVGGVFNGILSYRRIKNFLSIKEVSPQSQYKNKSSESCGKLAVKCKRAVWPTQLTDQQVTFALEQIDYSINTGELHVIIGKVSSGKTAFLHLLMNELEVSEPSWYYYNRQGSIAYVSQNYWLQEGSIRVIGPLFLTSVLIILRHCCRIISSSEKSMMRRCIMNAFKAAI